MNIALFYVFFHVLLSVVHGNNSNSGGNISKFLRYIFKLESRISKLEIKDSKLEILNSQHESRLVKLEDQLDQLGSISSARCQRNKTCGPCVCRRDEQLEKKFYCDCKNLQPMQDCLDFYKKRIRINGVYKIYSLKGKEVYCDQTTDGGGWTVFQRRVDGSVNFTRNWNDYKNGFGKLSNEFWLGNDNLHIISAQGLNQKGNELRIDMRNASGTHRYAKYSTFQIGNEAEKYIMKVSGHSGTADNTHSFTYNNNNKFSTYDSDNDRSTINCAKKHKSGWWFDNCSYTYLNGVYRPGGITPPLKGIHWTAVNKAFGNYHDESLTFTEMKIRRRT